MSKYPGRCFNFGMALALWSLTGCTRAPSFDILGSLFPAWLVCLVFGILLTALTHWFLLQLQVSIALPILLYPSLIAFFTLCLWLVFFG